MPRFLLPKRSSAHRIAAIALYRALLSQSCAAPLSAKRRSLLQDVIRNRFRNNKNLQSSHQLHLTFRAGYEALDRLDESVAGNADSLQSIASFLKELPTSVTRTRRTSSLEADPKPNLQYLPPEERFLDVRPHLEVSGTRHIPKLVSANGVPFLRTKKPQPQSLSRALQSKLEAQQKSFDKMVELRHYFIPLTKAEDDWDDIVRKESGGTIRRGGPVRWQDAVLESLGENVRMLEVRKEKDRQTTRKLVEIIDKEKILKEMEERGANLEEKRRAMECYKFKVPRKEEVRNGYGL